MRLQKRNHSSPRVRGPQARSQSRVHTGHPNPLSAQPLLPGGLWGGSPGLEQKTVDGRLLLCRGGLTCFFLLFQGSKGDPGMTGPTGAAGLPVSHGIGGFSSPTLSTTRNTVKIIPGACSKMSRAKQECSFLCQRKLPAANWSMC